jgi:large subunit ribosomal protein L6
MSRIGKLPIHLPSGTQARIEDGFIFIKGPKGELSERIHGKVNVKIEADSVLVDVNDKENFREKALWGLFRSLIANMVEGVNKGFEKKLELSGVGFRVQLSGKKLVLNLGFSHPVDFPIPDGISAAVEGNAVTLSGINKQLVGETAALIRRLKEPEPYKGKGIKYSNEIIRRKAGKTAAK